MSDKATLYLAGPMSGITWRQMLEWRQKVEWELQDHWRVINPVRAQVSPDKLDDIHVASTQKDTNIDLNLTATAICSQDEFFIDQSDWLLANFIDSPHVSIGTIWELGYAYGTGKKILSVVEPGSIHDHPFVRRRSHLFTDNLEDAVDFFAQIAV